MKKKGITLIEVIVAIASASIILLTLTATVYYISKVSNEVVTDANNNVMVIAIRDYIKDNQITEASKLDLDSQKGKIVHVDDANEQHVFDRGNILSFSINEVDGTYNEDTKQSFYTCTITFTGSYGTDNLKFDYLAVKK